MPRVLQGFIMTKAQSQDPSSNYLLGRNLISLRGDVLFQGP